MKRHLWPILYGLILTVFTLYVALDTFVIVRVYESGSDQAHQPAAPQPQASNDAPVITATSYADDNIAIRISEYREYNTTIYVADVRLSSPTLLRTAFANNSYGRNVTQKTSEIASANSAVLAINGDFYGSREQGYVARNGVLYRSSGNGSEALAIMTDGTFRIVSEGAEPAETLMESGAMHIFSFGPTLVKNGDVTVTPQDEVGKAMADNPRTAIGIYEPGHYVLLVSDGRTRESEGLTLYQLASFMQGLGVQTAYNLDGGGSSTMVFCGTVINNPTTNGRKITERSVSDIVYIGY